MYQENYLPLCKSFTAFPTHTHSTSVVFHGHCPGLLLCRDIHTVHHARDAPRGVAPATTQYGDMQDILPVGRRQDRNKAEVGEEEKKKRNKKKKKPREEEDVKGDTVV